MSRSKETRLATAQEVAAAIAPFCHGADLQLLATGKKSESTPARTETSGAGAFQNWKCLAVVVCGVVGLIATAGILATIRTPTGDLHVAVDDAIRDEVTIVATKDGKTVTIAQDNEWSVQLQEGTWNLSVEAGDLQAHLERNRVSISRGEETVVAVVLYPPAGSTVAPATPAKTEVLGGTSPPTAEMIDSQIIIKLNEDVGPVAYSPDGKLLATASCSNAWESPNDTSIYIWSMDSAKLLRTLAGSSNWVHYLAFSPNGNQLATAGFDRTVRVWDLRTPDKPPTVLKDHRHVVYRVAFSPDGRSLVSASEDQIVNIWDLESKRVEHRVTAHGAAAYVAEFTADGRHVVSADWHGKVVVTDAETGEETLQFQAHDNAVVDLDFSPDGKRLATASFDKTAKLWSLSDGAELGSIPAHGHWVWNAQFSGGRLSAWRAERETAIGV